MFFDLWKTLIRCVGAPFPQLDIALPGPMDVISENYPLIVLALAVIIALIVILVSRNRRRRQKKNDADPSDRSENQ